MTVGEGKCAMRVIGAHAPHSAIDLVVREAWWKSAAAFWIANRGVGVPTFGVGHCGKNKSGHCGNGHCGKKMDTVEFAQVDTVEVCGGGMCWGVQQCSHKEK